MEMSKIIKSLQQEIKEDEEYLKSEPESCWGYDEVCLIHLTRMEMCKYFLCMLGVKGFE